MDTIQLIGSSLGLGLLAGIRLYATVLAAGLAIRLGWITLPSVLGHLQVLADERVLWAAGVGCLMEFFADKVPWVDSLWDSVHSVIRPIGAALLGSTIIGPSDPGMQLVIALLCGGVALTGHSAKAATRLMVNHSPEPFSNIALSLAEDAAVPLGIWIAFEHPRVTLGILAVFLVLFAWLSPILFRAVRVQVLALQALLRRWFGSARAEAGDLLPAGTNLPIADRLRLFRSRMTDPLPATYLAALRRVAPNADSPVCVKCVATRRLKGLRNSVGYLCFLEDAAVFLTRRGFRWRTEKFPLEALRNVEFARGVLLDRLFLHTEDRGEVAFYLFKDTSRLGISVFRALRQPA